MPSVKLVDIAQHLRLSISTVSRALNPTTAHLISEPVRLRIQMAAAKLGYVANHAARQLVHGKSYTVGVVLATAFDSLFFSDHLTKVLEGLYSVLRHEKRYGCKLVLLPREKSLSEMDRYAVSSQVDGLLIATQCDYSAEELYRVGEMLQIRSKRPVVALNLPAKERTRIRVVTYDNRESARMAVDHLLKQGRRHIGLIYADNNSEDARERVEGYKKAHADHGLPIEQVHLARGEFSIESGRQAALEILKRSRDCDALFCINDEMAIGALTAIQEIGKKCPGDVAVMGFDGIEAGIITTPKLSTIAQPTTEMARTAMRLLIDCIEGKKRLPKSITIPPKLILRDSA